MESYTTQVRYEELQKIVEASELGELEEEQYLDPLIKFAGPISQARAYIFCVTAGESNTNSFSNEQFIAGLSRFGVENPTPCVSKRCGMYGNSEDIMRGLKRAEEAYGKLRMRIHTKRYSGVRDVMIKPKIQKVETNIYQGI